MTDTCHHSKLSAHFNLCCPYLMTYNVKCHCVQLSCVVISPLFSLHMLTQNIGTILIDLSQCLHGATMLRTKQSNALSPNCGLLNMLAFNSFQWPIIQSSPHCLAPQGILVCSVYPVLQRFLWTGPTLGLGIQGGRLGLHVFWRHPKAPQD